ncbi:hypothetical protein D9M68_550700 [compost metagenome]
MVAVLLQGVTGALHQLAQLLGMEQALGELPAQLLRPVAEQGPGRGRGIEEAAVGGVAGNQVGGVLGDQPVQPPRPRRLPFGLDLFRGLAAARQHPALLRIGNVGPDQHAFAALGLHPFDGALLGQAGAHQGAVVHRQEAQHLGQGPLAEQRQQRGVQLQRARLGIHQQARLRVVAEQGRCAQQAVDAAEQGGQQLMHPAQPVQAHALAHLHQQQALLAGLQRQVEGLAVADGGATQAAGQPAVELAQLVQAQPALGGQARGQGLVAGLQRVAHSWRQLLAAALMAVDARPGQPAQVVGLAHLGTTAQRPAQGIGPCGQGHVLALQAQPGMESNRSLGHGGSSFWGWARIYRRGPGGTLPLRRRVGFSPPKSLTVG